MRRIFLALFMVALALFGGSPADASCHRVEMTAEPERAKEGGRVNITVHRDGVEGLSIFTVTSIDGTAHSDTDYTPLKKALRWVVNGPQTQSFPILITDDGVEEPTETFSVRLSDPKECVSEFEPEEVEVVIDASEGASSGGGGFGSQLVIAAAIVAVAALGWLVYSRRR